MIQVSKQGPVSIFRMGRSIGPWVPYITHAFLVDSTLIDTGTTSAEKEFLNALAGENIRQVVNTHHHEDHIGNNHAVQERFSVPIYAHEKALPFISDPRTIPLKLYQHAVWKRPAASEVKQLKGTIKTENFTFQILHTPGHCPDHVCLYEPDRKWLFAGDVYLGVKVINTRADEKFNDLLSSISILKDLDIDTIFCSLKGVVNNGREKLKAKYDFMDTTRKKILSEYARGNSSASIRKKLFGYEDWMHYITGGHFSKQKLVDSVIESGK